MKPNSKPTSYAPHKGCCPHSMNQVQRVQQTTNNLIKYNGIYVTQNWLARRPWVPHASSEIPLKLDIRILDVAMSQYSKYMEKYISIIAANVGGVSAHDSWNATNAARVDFEPNAIIDLAWRQLQNTAKKRQKTLLRVTEVSLAN